MAITLVASLHATPGSGGGTSASMNTTGATFLAVCVSWYVGGADPVISDSKGNTWTPTPAGTYGTGGLVGVKLFWVPNAIVGSGHTFTTTQSGAYPVLTAWAFSGVLTTAPYDQNNHNGIGSAGSGPLTCGSITPTQNNELILSGWVGFNATSSPNVDSGMTLTTQQNPVGGTSVAGGAAYKIQTTAAAINPSWSWTGSDYAATQVASYKAAAAAAVESAQAFLIPPV